MSISALWSNVIRKVVLDEVVCCGEPVWNVVYRKAVCCIRLYTTACCGGLCCRAVEDCVV